MEGSPNHGVWTSGVHALWLQRYSFLPMPPNILAIFCKFPTNGRISVKYASFEGLSPLKTAILGRFCHIFTAVCCHARLTELSGETSKQRKPRAYGNPHVGCMKPDSFGIGIVRPLSKSTNMCQITWVFRKESSNLAHSHVTGYSAYRNQ